MNMSEQEPDIEEQVFNAIRKDWGGSSSVRLTQLLINGILRTKFCSGVSNVQDSDLIELLKKF